ncbi:hypothetical protein Xmir_03726 [Xenorhabdus miraniensis]|uniref:Uncharacterized protein n=1 Tax=Xenorhabdus miraniensis TaxID=351674 RepID=A0A2D0JL16_9GAMM|nr:hypothetical protein Xmir_03726 [Xenorhabdus miraniensis]
MRYPENMIFLSEAPNNHYFQYQINLMEKNNSVFVLRISVLFLITQKPHVKHVGQIYSKPLQPRKKIID